MLQNERGVVSDAPCCGLTNVNQPPAFKRASQALQNWGQVWRAGTVFADLAAFHCTPHCLMRLCSPRAAPEAAAGAEATAVVVASFFNLLASVGLAPALGVACATGAVAATGFVCATGAVGGCVAAAFEFAAHVFKKSFHFSPAGTVPAVFIACHWLPQAFMVALAAALPDVANTPEARSAAVHAATRIEFLNMASLLKSVIRRHERTSIKVKWLCSNSLSRH
jgi:hypothetical protein